MSDGDNNRKVTSPGSPPTMNLATSLDEMLGYQQARRLSMAGSGKTNAPKMEKQPELKSESGVAAETDEIPIKLETSIGSEHGTVEGNVVVEIDSPVKVESPAQSDHQAADVGENEPVIKTEAAADSEQGPEIKEESDSASELPFGFPMPPRAAKTPVKTENQVAESPKIKKESSGSDYAITVKEESLTVSDEAASNKPEEDSANSEGKSEREESPPSPPAPKVRIMTYHRDADIYVRVRNSTALGYGYARVRRDALMSASDVLKEKFGNAGNVIVMEDEHDSPFGLNVVFSMLHHKYHDLGARPTIADLYGLAQVVEKYNVPHVIVPFAEKWLVQDLNFRVIMAGEALNNERVMELTWIFGEGRWFSRTLPKVAREATLKDGVLMGAEGPFAGRVPDYLIDLMAKHRRQCLAKLRQSIDNPLSELIKGSRLYCRATDANDEVKESCIHQQLGGMISGLTIAGLIPFPEVDKYTGSITELIKKLQGIRPTRYKVPGISPHLDTHQNCGIRHLQSLKNIVALPMHLTAQIYQDFKRRGQKTGVFSAELYNELKFSQAADEITPVVTDFRADQDHFVQITWEYAKIEE
ncbi:hypothetical protein QBC41DRAFT_383942 [Cercophora samala]|uniref:Uncharacterized protein n=1 Tax=Cercophora samala TaxID=330535 RepID=A0AA39ZJI2_9PEZI|nr:hypothetical protein QBC41DRAFT_383942 [Cercophora samala]